MGKWTVPTVGQMLAATLSQQLITDAVEKYQAEEAIQLEHDFQAFAAKGFKACDMIIVDTGTERHLSPHRLVGKLVKLSKPHLDDCRHYIHFKELTEWRGRVVYETACGQVCGYNEHGGTWDGMPFWKDLDNIVLAEGG
jgi:hypothetical protein